KPPGACRDLTLATYTAGSIAILTRLWNVNGGNDRISILSPRPLPIEASWMFTMMAMFKLRVLSFESLQTGALKQIVGSYDCAQPKIVIDPAQRPLNLAAAVIHEMTHYFFDKASVLNSSPELLADSNSPAFRRLIMLDEAIAAVHAGYLQRKFVLESLPKAL